MPDEQDSFANRINILTTWGMSILNGAVGDYLRDRQNGLAIDMAFHHHNRPLPLTGTHLRRAYPHLTSNICILVHGLGCNEDIWMFRDSRYPDRSTDYGTLFHAELGYTPLYVRYNSGLSIAENGKDLVVLLNTLLANYPAPINEIVLIGHSMGGLVIRSACHYGAQQQSGWAQFVKHVFYLGAPHEGADLEKLGHVVTNVLYAVPNPITRLIGNVLALRSRGVKDLRLGAALDTDALDNPMYGQAVPWLTHAKHYVIFGTLTADPMHVATSLFGDGLVRTSQGRGAQTKESGRPSPGEPIYWATHTHHIRLAHDPAVYEQMKLWCTNA
jgi:pimeloyl-ACP methyl ester carboxylesterase